MTAEIVVYSLPVLYMFTNALHFIRGSRLRNKFAFIFIVITSIPVLISGGMTLYLIDISHRYDVSALELQLIDQKIEEIEKFITDTLGVLELRVGVTQTREVESSKIPWQELLVDGILASHPAFEEVSFINLQGKETAKSIKGGLADHELFNVANLDRFKVPRSGKNYLSEVYFTQSGPLLTISAPVKIEGVIIQVLSAEVNLTSLFRSISASRLGASGYLAIFDRDGAFISNHGKSGILPGSGFLGWKRVNLILQDQMFGGLERGDIYESPFGKIPVVGAGKKMPVTGWVILAEWPLEDADAVIRDIRNQILLLTLFSILAVLVLAPLFAVRMLKPIRALQEGAVEIEKGNFEKRVSIKTDDELEDLGGSFNHMAAGLKQLQELKNEFTFIAAHELRTPVTAIKGFLSMVFEGDAGVISEKLKQYLDPVRQANDRLIQLVNDILEIARSEAGRLKVEVSPTDMEKCVRDILIELKPLAGQKKISLQYEPAIGIPKVFADELRLKEIITNFVSNSIKYNNEGGWVKISHELKDNILVTSVADNGFGMSREEQNKVFEKFFRSGAAKVKSIQGTGLGLFITKELVEKMDGKVWFSSEEGKGTTFSFSLKTIIEVRLQ